jgi:hypothetical protein
MVRDAPIAGGAGTRPLAQRVSHQPLDAEVADLDSEEVGGDILQEVRLVQDQHVIGWDHPELAAVPQDGIGQEEVMVHDDQVGRASLVPHPGEEAVS